MIVRSSPAPVMACICAGSSSTVSTSTGERGSSSIPGTDRTAVPPTTDTHLGCQEGRSDRRQHPGSAVVAVPFPKSSRTRRILCTG